MSVRSQHHIGGEPGSVPSEPFGDIRDTIEALPVHAGGTGYRTSDIFTEKHRWLREHVPDARSVFEFGALCGYFLVTALDACPGIQRVAWCDSELHTPGSSEMVARNLAWVKGDEDARIHDGLAFIEGLDELHWSRSVRDVPSLYDHDLGVDVVHVDGEHTYRACIADLALAWAMVNEDGAILVDDSSAIQEVREAIVDFCGYLGLEPEWHETVNGFAVIRP